ncbi:MAG: hypothetical protein ACHQQS_10535 [Thermoanaerobaculales bacterium]
MARTLAVVALVALIATLLCTLWEVMNEPTPADDLLKLTQLLLSWPVITGGLAVGGGVTFRVEIRGMLHRIASAPAPK